jgi:hypothetical protein
MSRARRVSVAEMAVRTTAVELRRLRGQGVLLPGRQRRARLARKPAAVKRAA